MKHFRSVALWLLVLAFWAGAAATVRAEERILEYVVAAKLETDAALVVTERLTVNIEHNAIQRGIYRIFPIKVREGVSGLRHYGFEVLSASLDGKPVAFSRVDTGYVAGVALGNPNKEAPLGRHTYELVYRTTGHVRFLPDHDEIYYNVTGNFWEFPIDRATFTLELPSGGKADAATAYTGVQGASGTACRKTGPASFETTRALRTGEGLTVVVGWGKGLVGQPSETFSNLMGENRLLTLFGIPALQLLVLLVLQWLWTYRRAPVIIPLFSAPEGMTPGAVACLRQRGFPALLLQVDILWAAVNGYLRMDLRHRNNIILMKTDPALKKRLREFPQWAAKHCTMVVKSLFNGNDSVRFDMRKDKEDGVRKVGADKGGDNVLIWAYLGLQKNYATKLKTLWSRSHLPGIAAAAFGLVLFYLAMDMGIYHPGLDFVPVYSAEMMLTYVGGIYGLIMLFVYAVRKGSAVFSGGRRILIWVTSGGMVCGLSLFLIWFLQWDWTFFTAFGLTLLLTAWSIIHAPARLSAKGMQKDAKIRGLEMYIRTAEKDRLAKINAPEDTLEKYEEILPYAAALGCADAWQKRFEPLLRHLDYVPNWIKEEEGECAFDLVRYRIAIKNIAEPSDMTTVISAGAAAYATATSGFSGGGRSSSSSSGFSGGSSGGGSGGGGGGGW